MKHKYYLVKHGTVYKVIKAYCKSWQRWTKFSGGSSYEYYGVDEDIEEYFKTEDIVDSSTSKSRKFCNKKWAMYLI